MYNRFAECVVWSISWFLKNILQCTLKNEQDTGLLLLPLIISQFCEWTNAVKNEFKSPAVQTIKHAYTIPRYSLKTLLLKRRGHDFYRERWKSKHCLFVRNTGYSKHKLKGFWGSINQSNLLKLAALSVRTKAGGMAKVSGGHIGWGDMQGQQHDTQLHYHTAGLQLQDGTRRNEERCSLLTQLSAEKQPIFSLLSYLSPCSQGTPSD